MACHAYVHNLIATTPPRSNTKGIFLTECIHRHGAPMMGTVFWYLLTSVLKSSMVKGQLLAFGKHNGLNYLQHLLNQIFFNDKNQVIIVVVHQRQSLPSTTALCHLVNFYNLHNNEFHVFFSIFRHKLQIPNFKSTTSASQFFSRFFAYSHCMQTVMKQRYESIRKISTKFVGPRSSRFPFNTQPPPGPYFLLVFL